MCFHFLLVFFTHMYLQFKVNVYLWLFFVKTGFHCFWKCFCFELLLFKIKSNFVGLKMFSFFCLLKKSFCFEIYFGLITLFEVHNFTVGDSLADTMFWTKMIVFWRKKFFNSDKQELCFFFWKFFFKISKSFRP